MNKPFGVLQTPMYPKIPLRSPFLQEKSIIKNIMQNSSVLFDISQQLGIEGNSFKSGSAVFGLKFEGKMTISFIPPYGFLPPSFWKI